MEKRPTNFALSYPEVNIEFDRLAFDGPVHEQWDVSSNASSIRHHSKVSSIFKVLIFHN